MRLNEGEFNSKTVEHELHLQRGSNWYKGQLTEREHRKILYDIRLQRMENDLEYRLNWQRNEADMLEAMKERDYHHE